MMDTLTVSRQAWHFKFLKWLNWDTSANTSNLCSYFWNVVGGMCFVFMLFAVGTACLHLYVNAMASPFITYYVISTLGHNVHMTWLGHVMGSKMFYNGVLASAVHFGWNHFFSWFCWIVTTWIGYAWWKTTDMGRKWVARQGSKPPIGFIVVTKAYLRARKEKYCPTIQLVD